MESESRAKKLPAVYINTGKATLLAMIKLIEAVGGCFVLLYIIQNPHSVQKIVSDFFNGLSFSADAKSNLSSIYQILYDSIQAILVFELLLIILDGFGSFFTRVAHKGAGLVRFCHNLRYFFSIIGFILSIIIIIQSIMIMFNATKTANQIGMGEMFAFLGSYQLILYIVFILGAFWLFMSYDRNVAHVMKQISKEIKADAVLSFKGKNRLGRESRWLCGVLAISVVLSIIEIAGGDSMISEIAYFFKPIEILYYGSDLMSIIIVTALVIKFFLVNRCSADFDKAHQ